jgi:hypothetical protein
MVGNGNFFTWGTFDKSSNYDWNTVNLILVGSATATTAITGTTTIKVTINPQPPAGHGPVWGFYCYCPPDGTQYWLRFSYNDKTGGGPFYAPNSGPYLTQTGW